MEHWIDSVLIHCWDIESELIQCCFIILCLLWGWFWSQSNLVVHLRNEINLQGIVSECWMLGLDWGIYEEIVCWFFSVCCLDQIFETNSLCFLESTDIKLKVKNFDRDTVNRKNEGKKNENNFFITFYHLSLHS